MLITASLGINAWNSWEKSYTETLKNEVKTTILILKQNYINIDIYININIIDYSEIPFSNNPYHIETSQLIFFAKHYRNYKNMTV